MSNWTKEWPTAEGWYWFWDPPYPDVEAAQLRKSGSNKQYDFHVRAGEIVNEKDHPNAMWHPMETPPPPPVREEEVSAAPEPKGINLMTESDEEEKAVRIRIGPAETGWGVHVKDDLYRVRNVPETDGINFDGLVKWSGDFDDDPITIERGMLFKQAVYYQTEEEFYALRKILDEHFSFMDDYVREGCTEPKGLILGFMMIAYGREVDDETGEDKAGVLALLQTLCHESKNEDGGRKLIYRGRKSAPQVHPQLH